MLITIKFAVLMHYEGPVGHTPQSRLGRPIEDETYVGNVPNFVETASKDRWPYRKVFSNREMSYGMANSVSRRFRTNFGISIDVMPPGQVFPAT